MSPDDLEKDPGSSDLPHGILPTFSNQKLHFGSEEKSQFFFNKGCWSAANQPFQTNKNNIKKPVTQNHRLTLTLCAQKGTLTVWNSTEETFSKYSFTLIGGNTANY